MKAKRKRIGNVTIEFGYFPGEDFTLFQLIIFANHETWKTYYHIQIGKLLFSITGD